MARRKTQGSLRKCYRTKATRENDVGQTDATKDYYKERLITAAWHGSRSAEVPRLLLQRLEAKDLIQRPSIWLLFSEKHQSAHGKSKTDKEKLAEVDCSENSGHQTDRTTASKPTEIVRSRDHKTNFPSDRHPNLQFRPSSTGRQWAFGEETEISICSLEYITTGTEERPRKQSS